MIEVMTERAIPPRFDTTDEAPVRRHRRIAVDAMALLKGRMRWLCTFVTEDKLFGVVVFEEDEDLAEHQRAPGLHGQTIRIRRITRQLDPSMAE